MKRKTEVKEVPNLAKRIVKSFYPTIDGSVTAQTFSDVLAQTEARQERWDMQDELCPFFDALTTSLTSIAADDTFSSDEKITRMEASTNEFLAAVRDSFPGIDQQLAKLLDDGKLGKELEVTKGEDDMPAAEDKNKKDEDIKKANEDLAKQVETLTASVEALTKTNKEITEASELVKAEAEDLKAKAKLTPAEQAALANMKDEPAKKKFLEMTPEARAKQLADEAAGEEIVKVADREIKKSVVGEDQFAVIKSILAKQEETDKKLTKAQEDHQNVLLTKRAEDDFKHTLGTTEEKVKMLRAISKLDTAEKDLVEKALLHVDKLAKAGFERIGAGGGNADEIKKSGEAFQQKVAEIKKRDSISELRATEKARKEFPVEFKAYQDAAPQPAEKAN